MTKRILSVCLALVLLLGVLAGCSKKEAQTADDTKKTEQSGAEEKTSTQFAYQAQYYDLPEDIQWIGTSCVSGDTLYFTASIPDGGTETYTDENGEEYSYDTYSEVIFRFDLDTGECVQLDNYVAEPVVENPDMPDGVTMNPDGSMQTFNSSTNIQTMAAGADGTLWLFRQTSRYADDGTEGDSISELIQLDAHGTLLRTITPVSDEETDDTDSWRYTYIDSILSDDKGYVYTYDHQTVNVYGPDGSFVFSKSGDELNGQICQLSASEVGMTTSSADGKMRRRTGARKRPFPPARGTSSPAMMSMPISLWITAISLANAGTTARSRRSSTGWPAMWTATISTATSSASCRMGASSL